MRSKPLHLKNFRFEGELLPDWALLLDFASTLCSVSEEAKRWFSALTDSHGVDDSRTVMKHCEALRSELRTHRVEILNELGQALKDPRPEHLMEAWLYSLDTMIQQAVGHPTCVWTIESLDRSEGEDLGGGGITLRRF